MWGGVLRKSGGVKSDLAAFFGLSSIFWDLAAFFGIPPSIWDQKWRGEFQENWGGKMEGKGEFEGKFGFGAEIWKEFRRQFQKWAG